MFVTGSIHEITMNMLKFGLFGKKKIDRKRKKCKCRALYGKNNLPFNNLFGTKITSNR